MKHSDEIKQETKIWNRRAGLGMHPFRVNPWLSPLKTEVKTESDFRRMEYLNALTELSGSTEGAELESLASLTKDTFKDMVFEEDIGEYEE